MIETNKKIGDYILADENKRITNFLIDFVISSLFSIPLVIVVYGFLDSIVLSALTYYVIRFLYYFLSEYFFSKTLGKFESQTKVISSINFSKPTISQLIKRNMFRFFSIISAIDDNEITIHDNFSRTLVIEDLFEKKISLSKYLYASIFLIIGIIRMTFLIINGFDLLGIFVVIASFGAFYYRIVK